VPRIAHRGRPGLDNPPLIMVEGFSLKEDDSAAHDLAREWCHLIDANGFALRDSLVGSLARI
jgi:hypothetical protein